MDAPEVETVILASQAVERRGMFKSIELTMLLTRSFIVLAPFDQTRVRAIRQTRAADARARGASRFQQLWHAAQAPFALMDWYVGMPLADILTDLPTARTLGYADLGGVTLAKAAPPSGFGQRATGEPPYKIVVSTTSEEISLLVDGHTNARELSRLLRGIAGDRFVESD